MHAKVITDLLAPILIGQDARKICPLWEKMYSSQRLRGYATGFFTESIAGVDIALWDILGKFVGVPLYQLLGGKYRDSIPTYSGADSPEGALEAMETGFTAVKIGFSNHLAVATPNAVIMEGGNIHNATDVRGSRGNVLLKEPLEFKAGMAMVPEKPGLGIEFDEKELQKIVVG